jgi:hypothetical protein
MHLLDDAVLMFMTSLFGIHRYGIIIIEVLTIPWIRDMNRHFAAQRPGGTTPNFKFMFSIIPIFFGCTC